MARKSKAEKLAEAYAAEGRWLIAQAAWLDAARRAKTGSQDIVQNETFARLLRIKAAAAFERFKQHCIANSETVETLTPRSSPFKCYMAGFNCKGGFKYTRRKRTGAQRTADEAVAKAKLYKKPIRVTGLTLGKERHVVLEVNEYGEVTFKHTQYKAELPVIVL